MNNKYLLDLRALEELLSVSKRTILRMHKDGQLKLYKLRGKLVAKREEVIKALEEGLLEPKI